MGRDSNSVQILLLILLLSVAQSKGSSFTISSVNYPRTPLNHYAWRYIRVDVPSRFSSVSIELRSDVKLDLRRVSKVPKGELPLICFRDGGLPLPDLSENSTNSVVLGPLSNSSIGEIQGQQNKEICYPMQRKMKVTLTNEQIFHGVWYLGIFNGIGAIRTQSKMINRGFQYSYAVNVSVTGCTFPNLWGQHCNRTVESLSCSQSLIDGSKAIQLVSCKNSAEKACLANTEQKMYLMEIFGLAEKLVISADVRLNGNKTANSGGLLKAYARYGAMPSLSKHDYAVDIDGGKLIVQLPKAGSWYVSILPGSATTEVFESWGKYGNICYSLVSHVVECPDGKAGYNCNWERYTFQTVLQKSPFESYYMPITEKVSSFGVAKYFPLEPLLSNSPVGAQSGVSWTYFALNVPHGATGGNMHVKLSSNKEIRYEIYVRFGGLPSDEVWDYFYASKTNKSNGSNFFMVNNSTKEIVDFYILYVREGTWNFAIKHESLKTVDLIDETKMSISIERCPNGCSYPYGSCSNVMDASGLTVYSYCYCDRSHGGFDCSIEMVSHEGHIWQAIALIVSNVAAILPAFWALRQKAFAEWMIYTCSGISSGLYHACDIGLWCALNFRVLQFMDFWLSFMAIISTFIYLTAIDEASRRTIHAAVSILTALLAVNGPTRSSNVVVVIAIGSAGLLIGWLIELSTKRHSSPFPKFHNLNISHWRQAFVILLRNMVKLILKQYHWGYATAGIITLIVAGVSWTVETSESYWIWHSLWHLSIYTSSFLFLCSKATPFSPEIQSQYELTRQDSIPREQS